MVKRKIIGKIQLTLGIILLVVSLFGGYITWNNYKYMVESYQANSPSVSSNIIINVSVLMSWTTTLIILFVLSLLFITQGLVNISEEK